MGIIFRFFLLLILLFSFSGCSTLLNSDGRQDVEIRTEDAKSMPVVLIENGAKRIVTVPAEVSLPIENSEVTITNHPCFEPAFNKKVEKEFDYLFLLNFFWMDLSWLGVLVDVRTGMIWEYEEPVVLPAGTIKSDCEEGNTSLRAEYGYEPLPDHILTAETIQGGETFSAHGEDHLKNMTGLILTRYGGIADVASSVTDETGNKRIIASGNERHEGYQLAFRNPARQNALYYAFVPRLMQHKITIADFREAIPTVAVEGKQTLPFVVTDFYTGQEVDPLDPNRYTIRLDAGGVDLVGGSSYTFAGDFGSRFLLNLGAAAGLTLAEYQHIDLQLGRDRAEEERWRSLHAYQGSLNGYLIFPDLGNFFMEFGLLYMHYPELDLPKKVEFKNTTRYNETKQIFERERVFVDSVELNIHTFSLSLGVLF